MLTTWSRKLCPLLSLAIATIGCGKKIAEPDGKPSSQTQNQERPSAYILRLDGTKENLKQYRVPQDVQEFFIPESLVVKTGSGIGKEIEVAYEVDEEYNDSYSYRCNYVGSSDPKIMVLSYCVDIDDRILGDVKNQPFQIDRDQIIQMKFVGAQSSMVVDIIYNMTWF